jgi:hypothetical protein
MVVIRECDESLFENGEDVLFAENEVFVVLDLDLGARILAEQDPLAGLHLEGDPLAVLADLAVADGHDLTLLGLFLGRVGDDDAPSNGLLFLLALHQNAVMERTDLHRHNACLLLYV